MIRAFTYADLKSIDLIGSLISKDFVNKNMIEDRSKLEYVKIFVYEDEEIIKGFIEIETHFEVVEIINIAVAEAYQNMGIATSLLEYVIKTFSSEKILLEVKENNESAINFYKKNKFVEINRRKKYYEDNDAIIMERSLL